MVANSEHKEYANLFLKARVIFSTPEIQDGFHPWRNTRPLCKQKAISKSRVRLQFPFSQDWIIITYLTLSDALRSQLAYCERNASDRVR